MTTLCSPLTCKETCIDGYGCQSLVGSLSEDWGPTKYSFLFGMEVLSRRNRKGGRAETVN